jgi:hypothetical protein
MSLPEVHLPSLGAYNLVWMQNIAHWKPGGVIPGFCFSNFIKTQKSIHLMSCKKLMQFDLRTIEEHTGCIPWILRTPYSVKLFSSLLLTEAFRKPEFVENHEAPRKDIHFCKDSLGYKRVHISHTHSQCNSRLCLSDFKAWTYILKVSEFQIAHEKSHTDTQTHKHT